MKDKKFKHLPSSIFVFLTNKILYVPGSILSSSCMARFFLSWLKTSMHCRKLQNSWIFSTKTFLIRERTCVDKRFFVPFKVRIIISWGRKSVPVTAGRGNFFLDGDISLKRDPGKLPGRFLAGHMSVGQSGHKIRPLLLIKLHFLYILSTWSK